MPYIEQDKLAEIFTQLEKEKKVTAFLQEEHNKNKVLLSKKSKYKKFKSLFFILLSLFILTQCFWVIKFEKVTIPFFHSPKHKKKFVDSRIIKLENLVLENEQLKRENAILGGAAEDIQGILESCLIYSVQIGAFSHQKIPLISKNLVNFRIYPLHDFNAYSLGNFSTRSEAEFFVEILNDIGFEDAWIASYQSGKRILEKEDF